MQFYFSLTTTSLFQTFQPLFHLLISKTCKGPNSSFSTFGKIYIKMSWTRNLSPNPDNIPFLLNIVRQSCLFTLLPFLDVFSYRDNIFCKKGSSGNPPGIPLKFSETDSLTYRRLRRLFRRQLASPQACLRLRRLFRRRLASLPACPQLHRLFRKQQRELSLSFCSIRKDLKVPYFFTSIYVCQKVFPFAIIIVTRKITF